MAQAERQDQAEQEQQVVDAPEDVVEAELDEGEGGRVPAGIELEPAVAAVDLVGAGGPVRRPVVDDQLKCCSSYY